ncbi:MAG: BrnT family toxin [Acidobacteriota bacterium]
MPAEFEWDEEKNQANRAKHGIGFDEAKTIFDGPVLTAPDDRENYGEGRSISYGQLGAAIVAVVVHTSRSGRIRFDFSSQGEPERKAGLL